MVSGSPKVPRKATALKRWIVVDRCWKRNAVSLISPVFRVRRLPRSLIKSIPLLLIGPRVLKATGTNYYYYYYYYYYTIYCEKRNQITQVANYNYYYYYYYTMYMSKMDAV